VRFQKVRVHRNTPLNNKCTLAQSIDLIDGRREGRA
jgi:hypothetical protein